jgi:hypothetical protein
LAATIVHRKHAHVGTSLSVDRNAQTARLVVGVVANVAGHARFFVAFTWTISVRGFTHVVSLGYIVPMLIGNVLG